jgi:Molybdopterin-binding domain of aldehyde dehydrogenase
MHHHQHDARSDDPGEAAAIGTALPGAVVHEDRVHDRHAGHSAAMLRRKFWISLALTIPILIWGHMLAELIRYSPPALPGAMWIAPIFGTAVFAYGGWPFVTGAIGEVRDRLPGMMTLIALAIGVAFVFSVAVTFGYPGMPLWEELATLVTVMLLGHWLEMSSVSQAQGALGELAKLLPDKASRIRGEGADERIDEVPVSELREGVDEDLGLVRLDRFVGAYDAGRIINPRTARSQAIGGIIWGVGEALLEQSETDQRMARFLHQNYSGYLVPANADIPELDVVFVGEFDPEASLLGAKGLGELTAVSVAPAIVNAVYHATGKRIRDLPVTVEKLL